MGQTLSSPATDKKSESGGDARFQYSVTEMQGWRISMEDAHATVLDLEGDDGVTFFAVYDGHGGSTVAKYAGENVHKRMLIEESYREKNYEEALKRAFLGTDEDMLSNPVIARDPSGCTAVAALITADNKIYVANAGDSRSVISVGGKAKPLSFDHKPTNELEKKRIAGAGGYVDFGRVNGNLALSRALGDFDFKKNYSLGPEKQIITADPDITCHEITDEDEFLILACDGIWDCLDSQQVVDFIRYQVSEGKTLAEIGEIMCDHCLAPDTSSGTGVGCDNMTILIVAVLQGKTMEEWAAWVTDRVKNKHGYDTPTSIPTLYAPSRIAAFKSRQEAMERRLESSRIGEDGTSLFNATGLGGFARVLSGAGGISFHPGGGIMNDSGHLMFASDESDSDDSEGDERFESKEDMGLFSSLLGSHGMAGPSSLKEKLESFERDDEEETTSHPSSEDDAKAEETASTPQGSESSPLAHSLPNGDAIKPIPPVEQLTTLPTGDSASPLVSSEGLMDTSEDPLKG